MEAETVCAIFENNLTLCNELNEKVLQHFVNCLGNHGKHVQYLKCLQTLVKADNHPIRKCQDMVMQELINSGEDVLIFYNDKETFNQFVEMMKEENEHLKYNGPLHYHMELVQLLADCTMGKNVYTEIKCHSLLPLDDIIVMVSHPNCLIEIKEVYIKFLHHCYIDTEIEMKEIYTSNHIWTLFETSFFPDILAVIQDNNNIAFEKYVTNTLMNMISSFFNSPFSEQSSTIQTQLHESRIYWSTCSCDPFIQNLYSADITNKPIFVQLIYLIYKLSQCNWLNPAQRFQVNHCIQTLADTVQSRGLSLPVDFNNQINLIINQVFKFFFKLP